jgi:hypothetical protein
VHKSLESKLYTVAHNILIQLLDFFPYIQKLCIGSSAKSAKRQIAGSQVSPKFCILSMELALCHPSGTQKLDVASKFLENLWIPACYREGDIAFLRIIGTFLPNYAAPRLLKPHFNLQRRGHQR